MTRSVRKVTCPISMCHAEDKEGVDSFIKTYVDWAWLTSVIQRTPHQVTTHNASSQEEMYGPTHTSHYFCYSAALWPRASCWLVLDCWATTQIKKNRIRRRKCMVRHRRQNRMRPVLRTSWSGYKWRLVFSFITSLKSRRLNAVVAGFFQ